MAQSGRSVRVDVDSHALLTKISLDLAPVVGSRVTVSALIAALARVADRDRRAVLAELSSKVVNA